MMQDGHITPEDLILYAMQAMQPHELAELRLHLDQCAHCRQSLAEVNGDLALVAMSVGEDSSLPQGARQRFLDRLASDAAQGQRQDQPGLSIAARKTRTRPVIWIGWLAAAAMLLFAMSLLQKVHNLSDELARQQKLVQEQAAGSARARQVLEVLTAPAAQRVMLTATPSRPQPSGRAVYLAATGGLVFQANDLAGLPESKTYELWVIPANSQAPIPAGTFRPDARGTATVLLPSLPRGVPAKAFGVTIEKAEGSAVPTLPIILVGAVPAAGE